MAYGSKLSVGVSVRLMNYLCFLNTKMLFKYMRCAAVVRPPCDRRGDRRISAVYLPCICRVSAV